MSNSNVITPITSPSEIVIKAVCKHYDCDSKDVRLKDRSGNMPIVRIMIYHLLVDLLEYTDEMVAHRLGKDIATVYYYKNGTVFNRQNKLDYAAIKKESLRLIEEDRLRDQELIAKINTTPVNVYSHTHRANQYHNWIQTNR